MTDVLVIGGGALGLATAAELAGRGAGVCVIDDAGPSGSAAAAGMLSPTFEAVLDPSSAGRGPLLSHARELWRGFEQRLGIEITRDGAEWRGPDGEAMIERLRAAGFAAEMRGGWAFTPEDWRLDPRDALAALGRAPGVRLQTDRAIRIDGGRITLASGEERTAASVVLAGGWRPLEGADATPPVTPIKGQAVRLTGSGPERTLRAPGVYVAPARDGAVIGATMDIGRADAEVDPEATRALIDKARAIWPGVDQATRLEPLAGVRGSSPDGLPYAGRMRPGLFAALAPRRNGWLLAPLVGRVVADAVEGRDPGVWAEALDPDRFPT